MSVTVIVGMQFGDEGKGKVIDLLAQNYDYIVRYNGGDNAGHTIKHQDKKFALHLLPSGIFYPDKFKVIANGVVINPETLLKEIGDVEKAGFSMKNLIISECAHIVMPWHKILDGIEDEKNFIGTTKKGMGPVFADKAMRTTAIRVCDLYDDKALKEKLSRISKIKEKIIKSYGKKEASEKADFDVIELFSNLKSFGQKIRPYVKDTTLFLNEAIEKNRNIMLEAAQGTLLDTDHGTYPFVTSSHPTSSGACVGTGIAPKKITNVIGVTKAYTTRVGSGPFPTELLDPIGEKLRQIGREFGTTTGRPRRCGWLDLVMLRYAVMLNGTDELLITKLDVLNSFDEIKACVAYDIDGKRVENLPASSEKLAKAKPIYRTFKGYDQIKESDWIEAVQTKKVPEKAREYLEFIEKELGVKITMLSFGPEREKTVVL